MKIGKKILIAVLTTILVLLFAWIGSAAYSGWQGYKWQKQTDKFQEALRRPYKEDTYGGKTPEETWAMFLEALKKEDVELASKYFVVEKQGEWLQELRVKKESNTLMAWQKRVEDLQKSNQDADSTIKSYYFYNYFNSQYKQVLSSPVVFTLNSYTKVWKISVL